MCRRLTILLLAIPATLALAGCSFEFSSGGSVSADDVAGEAKAQLNEVAHEEGLPPITEIECDEDLEDEVGATTRCEALAGGEEVVITAEATEVDGDTVSMDFEVVE